MSKYLSFYGGDRAISIVREYGLTQNIVKTVAGAAGGPKWLILGYMDRFLFSEWFAKRSRAGENSESLFLTGSSAGAWRFAAASQNNPSKALEMLAESYIHQWYSIKPDLEEIDVECWKVLDGFIDDNSVNEILNHPYCRINFFSVRSKAGANSDNFGALSSYITAAGIANLFNRKNMSHFFTRTLFYNPLEKPPFYDMDKFTSNSENPNCIGGTNQCGIDHFPMLKVALTHENFKKALISSGSIPLVMPGVKNIPQAPPGVYRDGGTIDYHLDIPFLGRSLLGRSQNLKNSHNFSHCQKLNDKIDKSHNEDKIVLFPHYTDRIVPGWLDKHLPWRKPDINNFRNVLLITPTQKFTDMLPGGKIPERQDFTVLKGKNRERIQRWKIALKYSEILGDELCRLIYSGKVGEIIQPIKKILSN